MLGIALSLAQACCWAATSIMLKSLTDRLGSFVANGLRAACGLLFVVPFVFATGAAGEYALLTPRSLFFLLGSVAIGGALGDAAYLSSLRQLGVSRAFPVSNTYPIFTVVLSMLFLKETTSLGTWLGLALVLVGVYLISRPSAAQGPGRPEPLDRDKLVKGIALALLSAGLWGSATVLMAPGMTGISGSVATSVRIPVVAAISLLLALRTGETRQLRTIDRQTVLLLLITGILGWGISGTLYASAVKLAGPSRTAIIGATSPLFALPMSAIFLHERPTRLGLIGTVLSIAGIMLVA